MTGVLVVTFRVDVRHRTTDDDALRPEASGSTAGRTPQLLDLLMLKIDWDLHGRLEARGHMLGRWSSVRIESELASREPGSRIRKPRGWPRARCSSLEFAGQTARGCCGLAAGFGRGGCGTRKGNVVYFQVEYRIIAELLLRLQCRSRTRTNPYTGCATRSAECCQVPGLDAETATTRPSS